MSSQKRIDEYFKSTLGNRGTNCGVKRDKGFNRSKPSLSLKLKNRMENGAKTPVGTSVVNKKTWGSSNSNESYRGTPEKSARWSNPTLAANGQSSNKEFFGNSELPDIQIINEGEVTSPRKTIKSFAKACNSPTSTPSPGRISLKRRKNDLSSGEMHSPPKRTLTYDDVVPIDSEPDVIEIPIASTSFGTRQSPILIDDFSSSQPVPKNGSTTVDNVGTNSSNNPTSQSSISDADFPDDFDPDIVERSMVLSCENTPEKSSEKSTINSSINVNESRAPRTMETNVAMKKERNVNLSTSGNSPSTSPWKVINIQTADRLMTALSSDWQSTLDVTKKHLSNEDDVTKADVQSPIIKTDRNSIRSTTSTPIKSSPRRALFSPPKTATNLCSEVEHCASNSRTKINGSSNSPTKINGSSNSPTKINGSSNSPTKINGSSSSPTKINRSSSSPTKMNGSSNSPTKINGTSNSPMKINSSSNLSTKSNGSSSSPKKPDSSSNTTPMKTPTANAKPPFSPRVKNSSHKERSERVDTDLATRAVENLNQAKQGVIPLNDFDLEAIYAKKSFELEYGSLNTRTAIKYEAKDVQVPEDKHADHFFMVIVNVFSEPMNCGYFNDDELDTVFSILTLSPEAQSLLVRMLKRKRGWHRICAIHYPEIGPDLKPFFRELVEHGFLDDDISNEEMPLLLDLLQLDDIKTVCQAMNVNRRGLKPKLIADLVKLSAKKHSLFPGMKTPSSALWDKVSSTLGPCIRVPQTVEDLLNRIFILLIPHQDPEETMVDAFNMLVLVHLGQKIFPPTPKKRFPIFRNRLDLIGYAEARSAWNHIIKASKAKEWDDVRDLGQLAYDRLQSYFERNDSGDESEMSTLPSYVKRFDANYVWTKVLSKSIEAYKKTREGIDTAAEFLRVLISERNKIPGNRIRWYGELALIESHHRKDLEASASITIEALERDRLTEIDAAEMLERAKKLLSRKQGISARTKERINEVVKLRQDMLISTFEPVINEIEARMVQGNVTGSKSTWSVANGTGVSYMTVEQVALHHYHEKGFRGGLHCEGALPITLFATLFWSEIYDVHVPGAFVSPYQDAPLDLYSSCFFDNRRERIEGKLNMFRALDSESLSQLMHEDFLKYRHYQSILHGNLVNNADDFKVLVESLGKNGVIQICERLIGNYNQWKAGFPDLVVWDPVTKMCRIVEVKGPGDSLSTKQRLWLQFLASLGIPVEVCVVKGTTRKYA